MVFLTEQHAKLGHGRFLPHPFPFIIHKPPNAIQPELPTELLHKDDDDDDDNDNDNVMDSYKLESPDAKASRIHNWSFRLQCRRGHSFFALSAKYLHRRVQVMRSTVKKPETTINIF